MYAVIGTNRYHFSEMVPIPLSILGAGQYGRLCLHCRNSYITLICSTTMRTTTTAFPAGLGILLARDGPPGVCIPGLVSYLGRPSRSHAYRWAQKRGFTSSTSFPSFATVFRGHAARLQTRTVVMLKQIIHEKNITMVCTGAMPVRRDSGQGTVKRRNI